MTAPWPQPHEGITGTDRDDWLLSLDEHATTHRNALIAMARHLSSATLVGQPAPVVRRMSDRMRSPLPGDLVVETSRVIYGRADPDTALKGLGILLGERREWYCSDEDWIAECLREDWDPAGEERVTEDAIYIQYGPAAGDICRWVNSGVMALLVQLDDFSAPAGHREGSATVFTRDSLLGSLADSGFDLREPGKEDPHG